MSVVSKNSVFGGDYGWERFPHVYAKAINLSRKLSEEYDRALNDFDVLIMPTTITPADPLPAIGKLDNTCPFNATGHPALAFPIAFVPAKANKNIRVPTSMQVVGKHFDEITCLKVAYAWECSTNWKEFDHE